MAHERELRQHKTDSQLPVGEEQPEVETPIFDLEVIAENERIISVITGTAAELRREQVSPTWRRWKEQGGTAVAAAKENALHGDDFMAALNAKDNLVAYLMQKHPELTSVEATQEAMIVTMPDGVTMQKHVLDLLMKLDRADEEILKHNPDWKPWHER